MTLQLEQLEQSFKEYLSTDDRYAVMLSASWGTGKTYVWKKHLQDIAAEKQKKVVVISLFGISTRKDLLDALLQEILGTNADSTTSWKVVGDWAAKLQETITDTKSVGGIGALALTVANSVASKSLNENALLVFDDVERSSIPTNELLGSVNQFVEGQGCKVLLIADETKLLECPEEGLQYKQYREKVVRHRWVLESSPQVIFDILCDVSDRVRPVLEENKLLVQNIIETLEHDNLRTWITAVKQLDQFVRHGSSFLGDNHQAQTHLMVMAFLALYMQHCSHSFSEEDFYGFYTDDWHIDTVIESYDSNEESESRKAISQNVQRLQNSTKELFPHKFPSFIKFLVDGFFDQQQFEEDHRNFVDSLQQPWIILTHMHARMSNEDFQKVFAEVEVCLQEGEILDPFEFYEVAEVFENFFSYHDHGDLESLKTKFDGYLDVLRAKSEGVIEQSTGLPAEERQPQTDFLVYVRSELKGIIDTGKDNHFKNGALEFWSNFEDENIPSFLYNIHGNELVPHLYHPQCLEVIKNIFLTLPNDKKHLFEEVLRKTVPLAQGEKQNEVIVRLKCFLGLQIKETALIDKMWNLKFYQILEAAILVLADKQN